MKKKNLGTTLIRTGAAHEYRKEEGRVSVPETLGIHPASVYAFDSVADMETVYSGETDSYIYGRTSNPNTDNVQHILAAVEEGEAALTFSSGMAAIVTTILSLVSSGDHLIATPILYGAVWDFFAHDLPRFGVEVSFVDPERDDPADFVKENTKVFYTETIANPTMEVGDLARYARITGEKGIRLVVDNTFASPVVAQPLKLGADIVVYSATKYLGGHSDIVGGAVIGNTEDIQKIGRYHTLYGAIMDPFSAWLLTRSLRTLDLRVRKQSRNALAVAEFLAEQTVVKRVFYPGLKDHPSHEIAKRQFTDGLYGGMISFDLGTEERAIRMIDELDQIKLVPSLAGVATSISYPARTSHRAYSKEQLEEAGITAGTLRLSVGIEEAEDIIAELEQAFTHIG